ncbi:glycoside hydrolase family 27 protein [Occallatibacter riparius]|uniref:Alpha-galactosidase n=1 Tax=Occallatibacter riparius TaxID=1002689 RepID=A0A9J7BJ60_9BACT|nr:glycoside hydrolase family 27 protein [Occallatibacter riparius]UWZ82555.1 glycoside hydrolase family 27 protein [Occallatibacter riparius]
MSRAHIFRALYLLAIITFLFGLLESVDAQAAPKAQLAAPQVPPMGWNSWDAYGLTIDEAQFRDNVKVLAGMKQAGWQYAVIDEGWYMRDPFAATTEKQQYLYDPNGLLLPVEARFPSSANDAGFKPLSDWVHSLGLKFGIHVMRGIPKEVVDHNLPIAGSSFHAPDAADRDATCPWNDANYGVADNAAGQAYYDSMLKRYADWGVDYIKIDCISDHPYRPTEIRQVAEAIRKSGRPMVLSLSPGPTNLSHADEVAKYANMWRITDDHWDVWMAKNKGQGSEFPFGLKEEFDRIAAWNKHVKPGTWPDPDMLPEGNLGPHPGLGEARQSHYTQDEQRTEFTLWAISRSPLIFGGNLTKLDDFTRSLMTNKEVMDINQHATVSGPALMPMNEGRPDLQWRAWYAKSGGKTYAAVFNLADEAKTLDVAWLSFHLADKPHTAFDVWNGKQIPTAKTLHVELPPHGCALYRVE